MSFYTSLNGLKNAQTELSVIANNLANAETTGFKKSRINFADIVSGSASTNPKLVKGIGSTVASIDQDFSLGAVQQTGSALDLAINGEGFFTKVSPITGKTFYTRNGNFTLDGRADSSPIPAATAAGRCRLMPRATSPRHPDRYGDPADQRRRIRFPGRHRQAGRIDPWPPMPMAPRQSSARSRWPAFVAPSGLLQVGGSGLAGDRHFGRGQLQPARRRAFGTILSGSLEQSNVDIAEEMVGLITAQRYFQANAKAIDTATQLSQTVINLRS
jgi:flagellar hook protein FlgE